MSALVVGKDTTEYFRVWHLTLDAPKRELRPNMPVISLDGAVGTVQRVAGDEVDVQLTVDSGFGVDVVVERTGARGFVRGTGDRAKYAVRVEYVQRTDEVEVGDLLVTSGVGCRFPKGIPVARVTKVLRRDFGIYQTVEAEPDRRLFAPRGGADHPASTPSDCEAGARGPATKAARGEVSPCEARRTSAWRCSCCSCSAICYRCSGRSARSSVRAGCTAHAEPGAAARRLPGVHELFDGRGARCSRSASATPQDIAGGAPIGLFTFVSVAHLVARARRRRAAHRADGAAPHVARASRSRWWRARWS